MFPARRLSILPQASWSASGSAHVTFYIAIISQVTCACYQHVTFVRKSHLQILAPRVGKMALLATCVECGVFGQQVFVLLLIKHRGTSRTWWTAVSAAQLSPFPQTWEEQIDCGRCSCHICRRSARGCCDSACSYCITACFQELAVLMQDRIDEGEQLFNRLKTGGIASEHKLPAMQARPPRTHSP